MHGYAPINGINMYYQVEGNGQPLVLIHGGGSTISTSFSVILPLLAKHYQVIAVELQGHGHTSQRITPESFEQDADDVAALLSFLHISKAHIAGFSNGGQTAIELSVRHPAIIDKLVIISAFYKREGAIPGFFEGMQHATLENMPSPLKTTYLAIPGNTQEGLQAMFNNDKERMLRFKGWSDASLQSIQVPTLVIAADKDVATVAHSTEMAQHIPHASLIIVPGTHGSFIGEICTAIEGSNMPALVTGMIAEFLDQ